MAIYPEQVTDSPLSPAAAEIPQTIDELENHCFGCGTDNAQGLHLSFTVEHAADGQLTATATVELSRTHQGAPGFVHGGIISVLMDEAMSKLNRRLGALAMTRHMDVSFLRPAPLGKRLTLTATHLRRDGRKLFHSASLFGADGTLLAECKGLFIVVDPEKVLQQLRLARADASIS